MPEQLLTVGETAAVWAVSPRTVRRLIEAGEIKALRVGSQVRIRESELNRYLARTTSK